MPKKQSFNIPHQISTSVNVSKTVTPSLSVEEETQGNPVEQDDRLQRHMEAEQNSLEALLQVEKEFREYYELHTKEMREMREITEKMWVISQRYILSHRADPNCKYPLIYAIATDEGLINDFQMLYERILDSNKELCMALTMLRECYLKFKQCAANLDMTMDTPLIQGDAHHKPMAFFIELVDDVFKYFHSGFLRLDYYTQLLNPTDSESFDMFRAQLKHSEEFEEYLLEGLTYCKCLQPKPPCPVREKSIKTATERVPKSVSYTPPPRRFRKCIPLLYQFPYWTPPQEPQQPSLHRMPSLQTRIRSAHRADARIKSTFALPPEIEPLERSAH